MGLRQTQVEKLQNMRHGMSWRICWDFRWPPPEHVTACRQQQTSALRRLLYMRGTCISAMKLSGQHFRTKLLPTCRRFRWESCRIKSGKRGRHSGQIGTAGLGNTRSSDSDDAAAKIPKAYVNGRDRQRPFKLLRVQRAYPCRCSTGPANINCRCFAVAALRVELRQDQSSGGCQLKTPASRQSSLSD